MGAKSASLQAELQDWRKKASNQLAQQSQKLASLEIFKEEVTAEFQAIESFIR